MVPELDVMLQAQRFEPGARYEDHQSGDRVAEYRIAGLVTAVAGAKLLKPAAGAGLLVLLKKFGVVIVAALGGLVWRLKATFRRGSNLPPATERRG